MSKLVCFLCIALKDQNTKIARTSTAKHSQSTRTLNQSQFVRYQVVSLEKYVLAFCEKYKHINSSYLYVTFVLTKRKTY